MYKVEFKKSLPRVLKVPLTKLYKLSTKKEHMLPSLRSKDINAQREKISLGLKLRILRYIYIHNIKQSINAQFL